MHIEAKASNVCLMKSSGRCFLLLGDELLLWDGRGTAEDIPMAEPGLDDRTRSFTLYLDIIPIFRMNVSAAGRTYQTHHMSAPVPTKGLCERVLLSWAQACAEHCSYSYPIPTSQLKCN
jgi:hypothetical protein